MNQEEHIDLEALVNNTLSKKEIEALQEMQTDTKKPDVVLGFGTITFHGKDGSSKTVHSDPALALVPTEDGGVGVVLFHDKPETKD